MSQRPWPPDCLLREIAAYTETPEEGWEEEWREWDAENHSDQPPSEPGPEKNDLPVYDGKMPF